MSGERFALDYGCGGIWEQREVDPLTFSVVGGGDLDGDGDVDLFGWDSARVGHTAYGLGDGSFASVPGTFDPDAAYAGCNQGAAYRAGDVDGDEIPDIVTHEVANGGTATTGIHVHRGYGDGTVAAQVRVSQLSAPLVQVGSVAPRTEPRLPSGPRKDYFGIRPPLIPIRGVAGTPETLRHRRRMRRSKVVGPSGATARANVSRS